MKGVTRLATVNWNQKQLDVEINKKVDVFLHGAGNLVVNEFSKNSPVITGLLRNSLNYVIDNGQSGGGQPKMTKPTKKNTVRAGSNIIYAASVEKRGKSSGWMSKAWDMLVAAKAFERLAEKVKI